MEEKIKILHLEDDSLDAELLKSILEDENINCEITLVSSKSAFQNALAGQEFDLIFSDNSIPTFDGVDALRFAKKVQPNTPFIFFSGTIEEDVAIEAMRWGATDYVLKGKLSKLGLTAKRILLDSRQKKELDLANTKIIENETRLRVGLSAIDIAVFNQDKELKYTWIYHPQLDYAPDEVIGKTDYELLPVDAAEEVTKIKRSVLENNKQVRSEIAVTTINKTHYFNLIIEPLTDHDGNTIGITGASLDITPEKLYQKELLEAKEKAEEMNRLKSNFLANMSHELRTPLVSILGFTEILQGEIENPDHLEMITNIHKGGKRFSETLNLILSFSDFEANKIRMQSTNINVVATAQEVIKEFSQEAMWKNLTVKIVEKDKNVLLLLDDRLFAGILSNLISNAVKFTHKGGITIEIGKEMLIREMTEVPYIYVKVKDTGIGISEKNIDLIFDEFRQVSEGFARNFEGNGLGLTIAKRITELMGGIISVESKLGVGSIFTIKFPALINISGQNVDVKEKTVQPVDKTADNTGTKELPIVLYVEDDPINQSVVKVFLKDCCKVETANNGKLALQLVKEKKYHGFLMDINLGHDMDGITVTKEIKKMPEYINTPVIAVTAFAMKGDEKEFLEAGCTHYISKPFLKKYFITEVKNAFALTS
ncbi:MAG: response regulator [Ignavibacteriaceae bacterium]|jgi:signal transduction histidine kinase